MRPWNRGFVRVAAALDLPIVPAAVLGGEECLPVAWTVKLLEPLVGSAFGLPLSLVPLPARWRVVFHPAVRIANRKGVLTDGERSAAIAAGVRATVAVDARARRAPLPARADPRRGRRAASRLRGSSGEKAPPRPGALRAVGPSPVSPEERPRPNVRGRDLPLNGRRARSVSTGGTSP